MKRPILVTGAHRSGSTWTGRVICSAREVYYIQEPFNISRYPNSPFTHWFEHLNGASADFQETSKQYLKSFSSPYHRRNSQNLLNSPSLRESANYIKSVNDRIFKRPLYKDPLAVMSADWLYQELNFDIIVCIRHPAAFVASIKEKNWQFNFSNFLRQESLIQTYLNEYKKDIYNYSLEKKDIIDQGILLWNTIYSTVLHFKKKHGNNWFFVKNEELSDNPLNKYKEIFDFLQLNFSKEVKNFILSTSKASLEAGIKRDSVKNKNTWKERLTLDEINHIKNRTEHVWRNFYGDTDW